MNAKHLALIAGLVHAAVLVAGCATKTAQPAVLKPGVVASMTGPSPPTGRDRWQSAAQMAADGIDAKFGRPTSRCGWP